MQMILLRVTSKNVQQRDATWLGLNAILPRISAPLRNLFRPVFMLAIKIHACRLNYTLALRVHAQLSHFCPHSNHSKHSIRDLRYSETIKRIKTRNFPYINFLQKPFFSLPQNFSILFFSLSLIYAIRGRTFFNRTYFPELVHPFGHPIREQQMRNLTVHKPRAKFRAPPRVLSILLYDCLTRRFRKAYRK